MAATIMPTSRRAHRLHKNMSRPKNEVAIQVAMPHSSVASGAVYARITRSMIASICNGLATEACVSVRSTRPQPVVNST